MAKTVQTEPGESQTRKEPRGIYYGWWIVFGSSIIAALGVGCGYYALPTFYPSLLKEFHGSHTGVVLISSVGTIVLAVLSPYLGALVDRFGVRIIMTVGTFVLGPTMVLFAATGCMSQLTLIGIPLGICLAAMGVLPSQLLIMKWFISRRGLALGLNYATFNGCIVLIPMLTTYLIEHGGWRFAALCLAALGFTIPLLLLAFVIHSTPADMGLECYSESSSAAQKMSSGASFSQALRRRDFWLLAFALFAILWPISTGLQHLILYLREVGLSSLQATRIFSLLLLSSLVGRVVSGALCDWVRARTLVLISYGVVVSSFVLLLAAHSALAFILFALIFGFGFGGVVVLIPLITAECFGNVEIGRILGTLNFFYVAGSSTGPLVVGWIFDKQHAYKPAFVITMAAGLLAWFAALGLKRQQDSLAVRPVAVEKES